jgi:hypothetical protein
MTPGRCGSASPLLLGTVLLGLLLAGVAPRTSRAQQAVFLTERQALELAFPDTERVRTVPMRITPELKAAIEGASGVRWLAGWTRCYQGSADGQVVAYACIDNMIGKERPITYILRIDHPGGTIARLEVMEYRESIGGEVSAPSFVQQFVGKRASDPVRLRADIRNLSGATMSSRGLSDGARKLLGLYEHYLKGLPPL